jgi:hypothetical protein
MRGQLAEAATQGTEINETAHARSGTTVTMTPCVDAAILLNAIGLSSGGNSTHLHTNNT